jgi:dihydrolipoamide dehydrogenase
MAKMRKVTTVRGYGHFVDPNHLEVERPPAPGRRRPAPRRWSASRTASSPPAARPCACPSCPNDPRIVDSTGALELRQVPKRMLIIGGGIIGLEMGTVYSTLGARLDVVEMLDGLMQGADRDLVKVWQKMNAKRFDNIMLKTKTVGAEATPEGIEVKFEGEEGGTGRAADLRPGAAGRGPHAPTARRSAPRRPAWP